MSASLSFERHFVGISGQLYNETLKRTSVDGLPCEWLASSPWILHLLAW